MFGHKTSASTWEPPRRAIEALSEHNYSRPELIEKHKDLLDAVKWAEPPPAGCTFAQAKACANNQGVLDPTGAPRPSPHHIYVDDNLMAAISRFMKQTMASGAEGVFDMCGSPNTKYRQSAIQRSKWDDMEVSHRLVLLGMLFNTREMTVGIPPEFRDEVANILNTKWPESRQFFRVHELEEIVGKLGRIGQAF